MSLQSKVSAAFLFVMTVMLTHGGYNLWGQRRLMQTESAERARVLVSTLAEMSLDPLVSGHFDRLERQVDSLLTHSSVLDARVVNSAGRVVADTNRSGQGWIHTSATDHGTGLQLRYLDTLLLASAPIASDGLQFGRAEVAVSLEAFHQRMQQTTTLLFVALAAQLSIGIGFGLFINSQVIDPLRAVSDALGSSKPDAEGQRIRTPRGATPEIRNVAEAIESMRSRLETYYREERDLQRLRTLGEISVSLAHEIRNPLEAVSGAVELISRDPEISENQTRFLNIIREEVDNLNRYVSEFTQYGKFDMSSETVFDIRELIDDTMLLIAPMAQQRRVAIEVRHADTMLSIRASRSHIKRVVVNLLMNALEACSHGDTITIDTALDHDSALVLIRDTGPGIPEALAQHLFDPFVTSKEHGLGLGLALCKGIVEQHKGDICVSNLEDGGVQAGISLPLYTTGTRAAEGWGE
jgi:signal transduction histidine kinase